MSYPFLVLALIALVSALRADVTPAPLFTDNGVLQRDKPVPVWGTASAGEKISVSFAGQKLVTTADAAGKWRVTLAPLAANAKPSELVIGGNNTITLTNILVGEVWLASGQSNMEFILKNSFDAALDIPASANFPLIRHIKIAKRISDSPQTTAAGRWQVAGPATSGGFSAVAYYFALDLYQQLNIPVGIIHSSVGGSPVEAWLDSDAFKTIPGEAAKVRERWNRILANYPAAKTRYDAALAAWNDEQVAAKAAGLPFSKRKPDVPPGPGHHYTPSGLNNGMIAPLVPYALRGAIWYQGEANGDKPGDYHALFSAMINGWRAQFGQGDFPFYWVQLANYGIGGAGSSDATNWAFLREAQTQTLALPATGQAVAIDIGNVKDVHARNKKDVGRRLARLALARTYGLPIIDSGPVFAKAERTGTGFRVTFTRTDRGLVAPHNTLDGFEIAGVDRVFKPADAKIENSTVLVSSPEIPAPAAVRYAWRNAPQAGLFNGEGLPAVPFRTDTW